MGLFDKILKEDKTKELFEKNNIEMNNNMHKAYTEANLMRYFRLTQNIKLKRKDITQEMIDEYKKFTKSVEDNNIDYDKDLINFLINFYDFNFKTDVITNEIIESFNIYLENMMLLYKYDLKPGFYLDTIHKKKISDEELIKSMEAQINVLNRQVSKYTSTALSSRSRIEANKMYMLEAKTKIDNYERNIAKLSNNEKTMTNTMFCRFCGAKILNDSIFCNHCGKKL